MATDRIGNLGAVALVVQLLLVDTNGVVVPTGLTYEVQVRTFLKRDGGKWSGTKLAVAELSRQALLDGQGGGLVPVEDNAPAYLPTAGNDYFFASAQTASPAREAVLVPMRKRCESCHGEGVRALLTFSVDARAIKNNGGNGAPFRLPLRTLNSADNELARAISERKIQRPDFKDFLRRWHR